MDSLLVLLWVPAGRKQGPVLQAVTLDRLLLESEAAPKVHPEVLRLGLKYADGSISGANARCLTMLRAFSLVIEVRATSCLLPVFMHHPPCLICCTRCINPLYALDD